MTQPAIQVENLSKYYGPVLAVDHISFDVQPGEIVGFLGPNGAGKTTTMRILTTWLPATSGIARIDGFDVMNESMEVRRRIGYLPESVPLYSEMRVEEYLYYRAKLKNVDRSIRVQRIEECMEKCRIREVRRRLVGTLSKGYRQRVGLADALVHAPPILILDEPTAGLDPVQIRETLRTIRELAGRHTILFSTHILPEVEAICERVIIINKGGIREDTRLSVLAEQAPVLVVEARGPAAEIQQWLEKQGDVAQVHSDKVDPAWTRFEITISLNSKLRESIASGLLKHNWHVRRLDVKRPSLEDLFMRVVFRDTANTDPSLGGSRTEAVVGV